MKKIGAEHIIVSTDCGQTTNVYPTDCLVLAARGLRANGITQRELDLMYKVNPAKLLGLPPPDEATILPAQARAVRSTSAALKNLSSIPPKSCHRAPVMKGRARRRDGRAVGSQQAEYRGDGQ